MLLCACLIVCRSVLVRGHGSVSILAPLAHSDLWLNSMHSFVDYSTFIITVDS